MIYLEYLLLLFLIIAAVMAVYFEDEVISIIFLSVVSVILTTLYLLYQAADVALAEAVIGAGLNTAIYMSAISQIREKSK